MVSQENKKHEVAKSAKEWRRQYAKSVFLYHAICNPETTIINYPVYFRQELKIGDKRSYSKRLERQGLVKLTKQGTLTVSEKGRQAIVQDDIEFFQFACFHVAIEDYRNEKQTMEDGASFEQIMLSLLGKRLEEAEKKQELQTASNLYLDRAILYERVGNTSCAADAYVRALCYDLMGLQYRKIMQAIDGNKCSQKNADSRFDSIFFRPQVIMGLQRLKEEAIPEYVQQAIESGLTDSCYCKHENIAKIIGEIIEDKYDEINWRKHYEECYKACVKRHIDQRQKKK